VETSEAVFDRLWHRALHDIADAGGTHAPLAAALSSTGREAFAAAASAASRDPGLLTQVSASLLAGLTLIWAARGIEPEDIWMELHKRERLGSLLHEMASGEMRVRRRHGRPWRVDSTKLP